MQSGKYRVAGFVTQMPFSLESCNLAGYSGCLGFDKREMPG